MKRTLKKMLALLLALVMITSVFAGCDTTEPQQTTDPKTETQPKETDPVETEPQLEPVTLKWVLFSSEKEGSADVEEAFNAKLATVLPNTTVDFIFSSNYGENWSMMVNGGDKMDIAWGGYATSLLQDIKDGNIIALDDLINDYAPNIAADWKTFSNQYSTGSYEGVQYAIPCIQPVIKTTQSINMDEEFFEKYLDNKAFIKELRSTSKLTYKMLDLIENGIAAAIADGHIEAGKNDYNMPNGLLFATRGYMPLGEEKYKLWFDPEATHPEPLFIYEIPEVQMLIDRYAKWYDMGWFSEAELTGTGLSGSKINMSHSTLYNETWSGYDENGVRHNPAGSKETDRPTVKVLEQTESETWVGAANIGAEASYLVVPYTAENPERAMMLINLLHDEVGTVGNELYNLVANGFAKDSEEHKKYGWFNYDIKKSDDGQDQVDTTARGDAPNMHSVYNWAIANTYRALYDGSAICKVEYKEYCLKYYNEIYPTLRRTALAGMVPDTTGIVNELSALLAVNAEYEKTIGFGAVGSENIDALYTKVMDNLYLAGLNIVKAELQDQIDDFIANNK